MESAFLVDLIHLNPVYKVQVLFLSGVAMIIGLRSTARFFLRPKNYKGSGFFASGIVFVVWGWTLIGFLLETYGFWLLFRGFFPTALSFLRRMPFIRPFLDAPAVKTMINKVAPAGGDGLPV